MIIYESSNKAIQKLKKKIQAEVESNIRQYSSRYITNYMDTPIIKFGPMSCYGDRTSPAGQLYWSVANNRNGRFFVWSDVLGKWADLGGPIGRENPHDIKDENGNVVESVDYEFNPQNVYNTKEELLSEKPYGRHGDAYLIGAKNRVLDFLRLNLYSQFSVTYNSGPEKYLPGISRIACRELGFYSFDYSQMQGGKIAKLAKFMNMLYYAKDVMVGDDFDFDSDLNGLTFNELDAILSRGYDKFKEIESRKLASQSQENSNHRYEIIPIDDEPSYAGYKPVGRGKEILNEISKYVDWCICTDDSEYSQYTGNGGKFYVCLRDDYKSIEKPTEKQDDLLDDYAVSMIAVLVGSDGFPDLITTRYNHNYSGENNKDLWKASQLQRILNVNYKATFKPRTGDELRAANLEEGKVKTAQEQVHNKVNAGIMDAVCAGGALEESEQTENDNVNTGIEKLMKKLAKFMADNGMNIEPFPSVELDWSEQDGVFIKTGYYSPDEKKIVVFCKDRHIKDILRSFAHEMVHHEQNLNGEDLSFTSQDKLDNNDELKKIEGEAFLNGNLWFRRWTESIETKSLNESRQQRKNDEGKTVPEICPDCGGKVMVTIQGEPIFQCKKCKKYFGTLPFNVNENTDIEEYLDPEEVDLSSFNIKKELNPKFWKDNRLDSRVRMKLLDIADDFIKYLNVDWVDPEDIVITGSLANYNWAEKYSDIDIHVIYDFDKIDDNFEFVEEYFYSKKKLWNDEHEKINIYGFNVEMYVEDVNNGACSSGVYSLDSDEWVETPNRNKLTSAKVNKEAIRNAVSYYTKKIDKIYDYYKSSNMDAYKLEKVQTAAEHLFDKIKKMRKTSLANDKNEISNGNIVFKALRRLNYIEKLVEVISNSYDYLNSIY